MQKSVSVTFRVFICLGVIATGVFLAGRLASLRKPPVQAEISERSLRVDVQEATFQDVPVVISGLGTVRTRDVVAIAPEVSGRVVDVHPKLEVGELIPAGEILFKIDPRDFDAQYTNAQATVAQLTNSLKRLRKQFEIDRERLKTFERTRTLAESEYERVLNLYTEKSVGSQSMVDSSEMAYNSANDAFDQLSQALDLFPIRIQEAENGLTSARAMADLAATNRERTEIKVDFAARVKSVNLEKGQYVTPGANVLSLADDSIMEISVPLNSKEARQWLRLSAQGGTNAWFTGLEQVPVDIFWTENPVESRWKGELHRVEKFDEQTRQLTVVARISGDKASMPARGNMPLVDGMFCKVEIPGKVARQVVQVPAASVGFEQDEAGYRNIYIAKPGESPNEYRLNKAKVLISHIEGEYMYVSEGLQADDLIVTTRLIDPLDNALLLTNIVEQTETD